MTVTVRFAPSPTGLMQVGNIRLALVNWLFARQAGGRFVLRIDDTDAERGKAEYEQAILDDLTWLGLDWDRLEHQSARGERYFAVIKKLKDDGRLYPCYETPDELGLKRKTQLAAGKPPIYDRAASRLTDSDRARLAEQGRKPHWRFKIAPTDMAWDDLAHGAFVFRAEALSDPVVIREDGTPLYILPSVIDDIDFGITHIVRGEDHIANSAVHIQLFEALGASVPVFAHLPLLVDTEGVKLSKRTGALSVRALREQEGIEPMALLSLLACLGTSRPVTPVLSLDTLTADFDFGVFSRNKPRFDPEDALRLNARLLHMSDFDHIRHKLKDMGLDRISAEFWEMCKPNLERLADIEDWWRIAKDKIDPVIEDVEMLAVATELLPPDPWNDTTWSNWTAAIKTETGRKGKALFRPLRLALTGRDHGPEMKLMLPCIGRARALDRLTVR
ncbi:MAG: glutamate--tRNA ligase [Pseudomonadota bacterium]|nr:glutamate--tRNA ligase [Pseudomonadota bacterium]